MSRERKNDLLRFNCPEPSCGTEASVSAGKQELEKALTTGVLRKVMAPCGHIWDQQLDSESKNKIARIIKGHFRQDIAGKQV